MKKRVCITLFIFIKHPLRRIVSGIGIDYGYKMTEQNLETGFRRAQSNNEIIVLYAHRISNDTITSNYTIQPEFLEKVILLSKKYKLKSNRMKDASKFFNEKQ